MIFVIESKNMSRLLYGTKTQDTSQQNTASRTYCFYRFLHSFVSSHQVGARISFAKTISADVLFPAANITNVLSMKQTYHWDNLNIYACYFTVETTAAATNIPMRQIAYKLVVITNNKRTPYKLINSYKMQRPILSELNCGHKWQSRGRIYWWKNAFLLKC